MTREIVTGAAPNPDHSWGWRFSLADVARDGPFSIFAGIDRIIAVVAGDGMDLHHPDGGVTALAPFRPERISGDVPLFGRLRRGPVQDLNIMTLRGHFEADFEICRGPCDMTREIGPQDSLLIHALDGGCTLRIGGGTPQVLALADTLVHQGAGDCALRLSAGARAAVVAIKPLRGGAS